MSQIRHKLKDSSTPSTLSPQPIVEGVISITSKKMALQIIDTTLLKCYLQTNDALVAPLLRLCPVLFGSDRLTSLIFRLKDNCCHLEEAERVLKKSQKFTELVIFYNTRKQHRKALELLRSHSSQPDSPLSGHSRYVHIGYGASDWSVDIH